MCFFWGNSGEKNQTLFLNPEYWSKGFEAEELPTLACLVAFCIGKDRSKRKNMASLKAL